MNNVESACKALDFKLGQSWEMYVSELPKMSWTPGLGPASFSLHLRWMVLMVIFRVVSSAIHDGSNIWPQKQAGF